MSRDYYETLGVDKGATEADVKKAFRELAREHHPDHGGETERFQEINEAYETLKDPDKRNAYDNPTIDIGNPFAGFNPRDMMHEYEKQQASMRKAQRNAPRKGRDLKISASVSFKNFLFGGKISTKVSFQDYCPICSGRGALKTDRCSACDGIGTIKHTQSEGNMFISSSRMCPDCGGMGERPLDRCENCDGSGRVSVVDKVIELDLPTGMRDGQHIVLRGLGGIGLNNGPRGHVIVFLHMVMPDVNELSEEQIKVLKEL